MSTIVSFDPGIANFGWSVWACENLPSVGWTISPFICSGGVITTLPNRGMPVHEDDARRARQVVGELDDLVAWHRPVACVAEQRSFAPGAKAVKYMSTAWGIIYAISVLRCLPVFTVSSKNIHAKHGKGKRAVEYAMRKSYREANPIGDKIPAKQQEHFFDAVAAFDCMKEDPRVILACAVHN